MGARLVLVCLHANGKMIRNSKHCLKLYIQACLAVCNTIHETSNKCCHAAVSNSTHEQYCDTLQGVLLRSCFKTWRATAALEASQQAKLSRVTKLMNATFLWRCLQGWRLAADCSQKNRIRSAGTQGDLPVLVHHDMLASVSDACNFQQHQAKLALLMICYDRRTLNGIPM